MNERHPGAAWLLAASLALIVVARSAVFVFWPQAHFDSDQAVTGLMAKHLSELRAFPVFWYGQSYLLAVEAWLSAPVMRLIGPTVSALKLPLLAINVAVALLLFHGLRRDANVPAPEAAFATLFFALAAPITAACLLTANGGNVEPLLYVLLLWYLRRHPVWLGMVLGVGFLNREFTIYGAVALIVVAAIEGDLLRRAAVHRFGTMVVVAAGVWGLAQVGRRYSSAAGPGTSVADLYQQMAGNNLAELARRICFDPAAMGRGLRGLLTEHFPQLFGTYVQPIVDAGVETRAWEGARGASPLLGVLAIVATIRIAGSLRDAAEPKRFLFCQYLLIVSALSVLGYLAGRCGDVQFYTMRYELLSLLGLVALAGWYLAVERSVTLRRGWIAGASLVLLVSVAAHARMFGEYATSPPTAAKQELLRALEARQIRYGYADFWVAYYVTFLSRERIILAADDAVRIRTYNRIVEQHPEAVRVSRSACPGGEQVTPAFWICGR